MVVQEAPQEGQQKSCRAYQNLSSSGAAVDEVLFFPAGTLAFGHAAGWANATESVYANTHAWAGGGEDPLRPPRCRQPGVLRRHNRLMNPRDVRVLLFASRRDDVTRMVGTEALRRLAFVAGGTGGRGSGGRGRGLRRRVAGRWTSWHHGGWCAGSPTPCRNLVCGAPATYP